MMFDLIAPITIFLLAAIVYYFQRRKIQLLQQESYTFQLLQQEKVEELQGSIQEIQLANTIHLELINRALLKTSNISRYQVESDLDEQFHKLAEAIGEIFEVEYCNIGMCKGTQLEDSAVWMPYVGDEKCQEVLNGHSKRPLADTLVGKALKKSAGHSFSWSAVQNGSFTNAKALELFGIEGEVLDIYRTCVLKSGNIDDMIVQGIYNEEGQLMGYLHLINKYPKSGELKQGFSAEEKNTVELIAKNIAILLANLEFHRSAYQDERKINEWYSINDIDELLHSILAYLNEEFDSIIASYSLLAENGFEEEEKMVVTRAYYLDPKEKEKYETYIESNGEARVEDSLAGQMIMDRLPFQEPLGQQAIRFVNYKEDNILINWGDLPSEFVIGIPIMKSPPNKQGWDAILPKDRIWGVICLRPRTEIIDQETTRQRLEAFASHLQVLVEKAIYKRRFTHIETLSKVLKDIDLNLSEQAFYERIASIVKQVSDSEACSIFLASRERNQLYLRASTTTAFYSKDAYNHRTNIDLEHYLEEKIGVYPLYPANSITAKVLIEKRPILVYDIDTCGHTNYSFMEQTASPHKSLIAVPLIDGNGNAFGVLRCINKQKEAQLLHVFVKGDYDLLEIITGILSSYIRNKEYNEQRNTVMTHFGHESRGPLQAIEDEVSIIKFLIKQRFDPVPSGMKNSIDGLTQNMAVLLNNIRNTENMFLEKVKEKGFNFDLCNMHEFIHKIAKLFSDEHPIIPNTKEAPALYIDKERFHQVVYNLISNAKRYSDKGAVVKIFYNQHSNFPYEGWHQFEFQNKGIGIEEGEEDNIFNIPYYRTDRAKEKFPTGTGIGLKVCKEIVEKHGGVIKVTRLKNPTVFSIFLPNYLTHKTPE